MADGSSKPLNGMSDLTASEIFLWQELEATAREVCTLYGFTELRTPMLERIEVFTHSLGETTEVVQKEMYDFTDRGGRHICLRPEGTAGVMRHAAGLGQDAQNARWFYMGPMFRAERPQAGRKRQFHQIGVEAVGEPNPIRDAEVIALQSSLLKAFDLSGFRIRVNTRGTAEDQIAVQKGLRAELTPRKNELSEDSQRRLDSNVLRILDAKDEATRAVVDSLPPVTHWMSPESLAYLDQVCSLLESLGLPVERDPKLVRGLDYYQHTVWEISHDALGAQDSLAGGGRYRIKVGSKAIEGVGFAVGIERVIMALTAGGRQPQHPQPDLFLVSLGDEALKQNFALMHSLRDQGFHVRMDLKGRNMKKQMNEANSLNVRFAGVRGDEELGQNTLQLKDMNSGEQKTVTLEALSKTLREEA